MNRETITLSLGEHSYDIVLEPGCLSNAGSLLNLNRKVLVVTDSGVPESYADTVAASALAAEVVRIPEGESSKSFDNYRLLLRRMLALGMGRGDCVAAVGGGVVGDLSGFAAACYMRGIDFYNIPTTVLSQVDSSIGGKTAIDLDGIKNVVGAFYQPRCVLVDPATLSTLPRRQIANGLAEAVKMALCFDQEAFARRADKLAAFYDEIQPFLDVNCIGSQIEGEAIADLVAMKILLRIASKDKDFDYDQFFRAFAQTWRTITTLQSEDFALSQDTHPLPYLRVNCVVQQFDEFYDTYGVKKGDGMYLAPEARLEVW